MADTMDTAKRHWQDVCNFLLGVWLIFSPWIFGFTHVKYAAGNSYILGAIIGVAAASVLVAFHEWEEWVNMVLGLWLIVSPWILKFGTATVAAAAPGAFAATWNFVIVGLLVIGLAAWSTYLVHRHGHAMT